MGGGAGGLGASSSSAASWICSSCRSSAARVKATRRRVSMSGEEKVSSSRGRSIDVPPGGQFRTVRSGHRSADGRGGWFEGASKQRCTTPQPSVRSVPRTVTYGRRSSTNRAIGDLPVPAGTCGAQHVPGAPPSWACHRSRGTCPTRRRGHGIGSSLSRGSPPPRSSPRSLRSSPPGGGGPRSGSSRWRVGSTGSAGRGASRRRRRRGGGGRRERRHREARPPCGRRAPGGGRTGQEAWRPGASHRGWRPSWDRYRR